MILRSILVQRVRLDVRIYVLITSCDPLRVYIFNNGLVRQCREKYQTPSKENSVSSADRLLLATRSLISSRVEQCI